MKAPNPNLISKKSKLRGLFARVQTPTNYVPVRLEWCRRAKPARKTQLKATLAAASLVNKHARNRLNGCATLTHVF